MSVSQVRLRTYQTGVILLTSEGLVKLEVQPVGLDLR